MTSKLLLLFKQQLQIVAIIITLYDPNLSKNNILQFIHLIKKLQALLNQTNGTMLLEMLRVVASSSAIVGHKTERLGALQNMKRLRAVALSFAIVGHRT